jgi:glutathione peroxidase
MPATSLTLAVIAGFLTVFGLATPQARAQDAPKQTAYDFEFTAIDGDPLPLSAYKNKVLLVVNTASRCGFTPQYEGLQKLYDTYKDMGLVVIGIPANDFGGQEPGSNKEIKEFCTMNFAINFPMAEKVAVTGTDAHPFYKWAGAQGKGGLLTAKPRWNFHKYLVGPDGTLMGLYASLTKPDSAELIKAIEAELAKIKP